MKTLQEKGKDLLEAIAEMRKLFIERDKTLAQLEKVAYLMSIGVDPDQVKAYGFDPMLEKRAPKKDREYNYILLKDGTRFFHKGYR